MTPLTPEHGVPPQDRSPWAAPAQATPQQPAPPVQPRPASQPAPQPMMAAQPPMMAPQPPMMAPQPPMMAPQPPQVAAPQVAAPQVAAAAQGRKRPGNEDAGAKGKFRETMWFKKGELDVQAAEAAAAERQRTGKVVDQDRSDSLPMDERYKDDGSITRGDKEKYSLRTGSTMMMDVVRDQGGHDHRGHKVSEDALIGEMKSGRALVILAILIGIVAIGGIVFLIAR